MTSESPKNATNSFLKTDKFPIIPLYNFFFMKITSRENDYSQWYLDVAKA